ncbi:hypothetical protein [Acidiphilium multivorum]|uniref:Uncharacterized protein n=1 Tax=Acidiphilium multivorum (strain DSM 11245 / JCM 8867 / NBRC 100883 / AIU 301) TaxID=926570 RepID=F0J1S9_ACIMA|nr:hypothetical protein [Acidiphilium multivorum]MBS3023707.1 hypothetical protein [Acidiphilium multivorum]MBU6356316.1 hypothetical protein [Rhodospirillales bacterium]BAJ79515.1 hypothetical protein ACMV_01680 [Acidiphilium multivorum AIU301]GAN75616.1 hypothetical protein Apmu_0475_02 [Acidiphilium multivorum AIU301]
MPRPILTLALLILPLAACTFGAPPPASPAEQADIAACTQQANAYERARDYAYLSRTDQFATPFQGTPDQGSRFDRLAEIHARRDMISRCVRNANPAYVGSGASLPEPTIVGPAR